MNRTHEEQTKGLARVHEPIIDPDRPLIDTHHHIWAHPGLGQYFLDEFWQDTSSGHNVIKSVFMECGWSYFSDGPDALKPVGETEFVAGVAEASRAGAGPGRPEIAGMIGAADLRLGEEIGGVLDAHAAASGGRFRGIRHALARNPAGRQLMFLGAAPKGLAREKDFRAGARLLGARGLIYETWHFQAQNTDFIALARACPETAMVMQHMALPVGPAPFADGRDEVYEAWKADIAEIATCENVVLKIGALVQAEGGLPWHVDKTGPATSDDIIALHGPYLRHAIECFGPNRCIFGSNFPADKFAISYPIFWNAMKKLTADYSEDEKDALFRGTAARVYGV